MTLPPLSPAELCAFEVVVLDAVERPEVDDVLAEYVLRADPITVARLIRTVRVAQEGRR